MNTPNEVLYGAIIIPAIYLYIFNNKINGFWNGLAHIFILEYIGILFCETVIFREPIMDSTINTVLFWGYHDTTKDIYIDNLINIIAFIPIGFLSCIITKRYVIVKALFTGLFVSESIECCQLIFKRGSFDVDDIFNNTLGSLIGAIIYIFFVIIWKNIELK